MDHVNQTKEFLKKLAEEAKKRRERIERQNILKIWDSLSDKYKEDFAERIFDLAECYERRNHQDALEEECQKQGHDYGKWVDYTTYWQRVCKRCGNIDRSLTEPKPKTKRRGLFKKNKD